MVSTYYTCSPLVFCRMMEEKVRNVPSRLVGWWGRGTLAPSGVVGEVGTGVCREGEGGVVHVCRGWMGYSVCVWVHVCVCMCVHVHACVHVKGEGGAVCVCNVYDSQ